MLAEASDTTCTLQVMVALPPLRHRGTLLKGILMASDADALVSQLPHVRELFHVVTYAANGSALVDSVTADALMAGYTDEARDAAFRQLQPDRHEQIMLPLSPADFFNEQRFAPRALDQKVIDVLHIAPSRESRGLPTLALALKFLQERESGVAVRASVLTHEHLGVDGALPVLRAAKVYVHMGTDCGKDIMVQQAMACDVPVVTLPSYDTHVYGGVRDMRSGLTSPGDDHRTLAAVIGLTLARYRQFRPRDSVLQASGRRYALNVLIDAFPYYAAKLPGYERGAHEYNRWIDAAMTTCYGTYLHAYLFHDAAPGIAFNGLQAVTAMVEQRATLLAKPTTSDDRSAQCA